MMYGSPPFYNRDHEKMFHDIVNRELFFDNTKADVSENCKNMIYTLLRKDPEKRLGSKNEDEIKLHPWFEDIDWSALLKKEVLADLCRSNLNSYPALVQSLTWETSMSPSRRSSQLTLW